MLSKDEIRREARQWRAAVEPSSLHVASEIIRQRILTLEAVRDATVWFVYASTDREVDTHHLIRELLSSGNVVAVPRVTGRGEMIARQIRSLDELELGEFGILAPPAGQPYVGQIDVCICPALAFSENGHRLGSGGGYYDRFLAIHQPRLAIGLALEAMIQTELPSEIHDRAMDYVITEKRVIKCR